MFITPGQPTRFTTAKEYELLPEGAPYQLIGGELVMSPAPIFFHQRVLGRLFRALSDFVEVRDLGEVVISPMDVHLTVIDVYQPDMLFIRNENLPKIDPTNWVRLVPDMVLEVLSPSTSVKDYNRKKTIYGECGVREYWIVDPIEHTVEILVNESGSYRRESIFEGASNLISPMFPGFSLRLDELFRS